MGKKGAVARMIRHAAPDWRRGRRRLHSAVWRLTEPPAFLPPFAVQAIKVAVASGLAWGIGQALHSPRPYAAVLAVIILMAGHAYSSLLNALHFVIGVVGGLLLGLIAIHVLGASTLFVAALVFVCMLIGGWLRVSRHSNQIAVSALLVVATGSADNVERLWETALGGAVGVVVASLLWPPNPIRGLRQQYHEARARIREDVLRTIEVAGGPGDAEANRRHVRDSSERVDRAVTEIGEAEEALRWNAWHAFRVRDLSGLEDRLRLISYLYRTVRAIARQALEAPPPEGEHEEGWDRSYAYLAAAGGAAAEAVERRLDGAPSDEAIARGRREASRFAQAAPHDRHAIALAAALADLLTDVEHWRPPNRVDPDRRLTARVRRASRRLGRRGQAARPVPRPERELEPSHTPAGTGHP